MAEKDGMGGDGWEERLWGRREEFRKRSCDDMLFRPAAHSGKRDRQRRVGGERPVLPLLFYFYELGYCLRDRHVSWRLVDFPSSISFTG